MDGPVVITVQGDAPNIKYTGEWHPYTIENAFHQPIIVLKQTMDDSNPSATLVFHGMYVIRTCVAHPGLAS